MKIGLGGVKRSESRRSFTPKPREEKAVFLFGHSGKACCFMGTAEVRQSQRLSAGRERDADVAGMRPLTSEINQVDAYVRVLFQMGSG